MYSQSDSKTNRNNRLLQIRREREHAKKLAKSLDMQPQFAAITMGLVAKTCDDSTPDDDLSELSERMYRLRKVVDTIFWIALYALGNPGRSKNIQATCERLAQAPLDDYTFDRCKVAIQSAEREANIFC